MELGPRIFRETTFVAYSRKIFEYGVHFLVFRTHVSCAKISTYKNFDPRLRECPIPSLTATFCLLRRSGYPCKYGSLSGSYYCLDGERNAQHDLKNLN